VATRRRGGYRAAPRRFTTKRSSSWAKSRGLSPWTEWPAPAISTRPQSAIAATVSAALSAEIQRVHQFVTFASNTPIQHAYAEFTRQRTTYDDLSAFYQAKRDRFLELIAGSRFAPVACCGTYFQILDYSSISHERDADFALRLLKEHGVASIPTSAFLYNSEAPRVLRFCFAKKDETLVRAAERLAAV